ncbi:FAD:protein FMN transferase, partial [bacterium]|nr:FAD:protein FMN transferase [bacterium]
AKWAVGIQSPDIENTSESLDTLYADKSMSVVTSGDYQRYYIGPDDVVYHHLIDPSTLYPARQARSVTILIEDSGLADTLAKPLFILPYDQALAFLEKFNEDHPDVFMGAVWVYDKGMQPAGTQAIDVGEFSLVHSENIKPYSRLYNE